MVDHHRLRRLDLNLLHSLDSLLRERNVSRAAAAVGVSQPVMSAALGRLRRHFDDELLVRRGNRYELTSLAKQLGPAVTDALRAVDRVIAARTRFDPTLEHEFTVVCGEVLAAMLLPRLCLAMRAAAPATTLRVVEPGQLHGADIADHLAASADGVFLAHGWLSGLESIDVLDDQWVFAVSADDPAERLSAEDLDQRPWVVAQVGQGNTVARGMQQILAAGVRPRAEVIVSGSMSMPFFLRDSDRIAVMGRRLITEMGHLYGIREIPGPWELDSLRTAFWWHPSRRDDPAHQWLRGLLENLLDEDAESTRDAGSR
ncbi:LysR family transcriptional regulator [Nocardioides nitrophenolicus]|uniref:LysR family transcriptional regulator n=1 Tax=Nocardioides nitrophenolicus TaxID=60489 RepID=UPI00195E09F7|nr:LysR family transcriptional regulator [Nocardioides nitrophenolicus]MBM7519122.1 DNA-binding transcriptional LysR family regulator [Nocardioides nitrophenolicus]